MAMQLRNTGISIVGEVPWGTHLCHFYETKQDLLDTLVPYFKAGLESREFCLWVVSDSELITAEEAKAALKQAVPDLDRHLSEENIEIINGLEWYLEENVFNLERVTNAWDVKLKRALARGYDGLRVSGDTIWLSEKDWKDFCAYEKQVNDSITDRPMTVLCTYPLAKSGAAELLDVMQSHQIAVARRQGEWEVIETPELIQVKAEIKRLNADLEQKVAERTSELAATNEALRSEIAERKRADETLRETQQKNETLVHSIDGIVWEVDAETFRFTLVSKQAERILGYPLAQWLEPHFWTDHLHPDDRDWAVSFCVDATQRRVDHQFEYRMMAADGRVVWLRDHVTVDVRMDESVRLRGVILDITERKRAEESLTESQRYLHALFHNSLDAILVTNDTGRYIDANPAACALLGYTHEEVTQLSIMDLTAEPFRQSGWAMWQQFLARGSNSGEYSGLRKDGTVLQLEFRAVANILPGVHVSSSRDITERKRTEDALIESERRLAEAQRVAHVGYWERNIDTGEIIWSDETYRIFGLQPLEPIESFEELIHPEDRPVQAEATARTLRGEPYDVYYRVVQPDGEVRLVHSEGEVIRDESGRPRRAFGTVQDVTEQKRAEERLKATSEQLRALSFKLQSAREEEGIRIAREIHDELGATLTSLRWDLEGIEKMFSEPRKQSQVPVLRKKIAAMLGLTDTTLNIVRRIASELRPSVLDDLGLMAAIEWQAQQFGAQAGIVCQCNFRLEDLDLDQQQSTAIFRVFQEALTNVLRHAQATRVDITLEKEDDELVLAIRDNGRGITAEQKSDRLSLGLLGMRERVKLIGGTIHITGVEGKGTVITVRVPIPGESDLML